MLLCHRLLFNFQQVFAFVTFKATLGQDLGQWEGKARLCHALTHPRSRLWETHQIPCPCHQELLQTVPLTSEVSLKGDFHGWPASCPALHKPLGADGRSPFSLSGFFSLLDSSLSSHSQIYTFLLHTFFPLCLMSVASPEPALVTAQIPLSLPVAVAHCAVFAWFYFLCFEVSVVSGRGGCVAGSNVQRQEVRKSKTNEWISVLPQTMRSSDFPALFYTLSFTRQPFCSISKEHSLFPRFRTSACTWGPSLSFCSGVPRLSHPCHQLKDDDDKDLCVPIAWRTGLGWPIF